MASTIRAETEEVRMKSLRTEEDETGLDPPEMMMVGGGDRRMRGHLPGAGDQWRQTPPGGQQQEDRRLSSRQETGGWRESLAPSLSRILLILPTESKSES